MKSTRILCEHTHGRRVAPLAALLAAALTALLTTTPAAATNDGLAEFVQRSRLTVFGLTAAQELVSFRASRPQRLREIGWVSGLTAGDTTLVGIDFRVQDGLLYGVGNGGGIYTIDTNTAVATPVSNLTIKLDGTSFGVDFNPAADRLRIISDTGQNLRHNVNAGGTTLEDTRLNYTAGTPATGLTGAAYTNNDLDANTGTTLFNIDTVQNQVAIQSPPNAGSLVATGKLVVDPDTPVGFDIFTGLRDGTASTNAGFASLVVNGMTGFYRVNLLTGEASLIRNFNDAVIDIAIPLDDD